jgi:tartrate dehydratase alpha subunit/fumarate hydratase class I-like protein
VQSTTRSFAQRPRCDPDALEAMRAAAERERSPRGRAILGQLLENAAIAADDRVPLCQDTGSVWVLIEVGRTNACAVISRRQ